MADHDTFQDGVVDGDTMSDGWFNGCYDAVKDTSTGHDHDGTDSKKVTTANLDVTALSPLNYVRVNSGGTALEGIANPFNTSTGHDHDGTDSKSIIGQFLKYVGSVQTGNHTGDTSETEIGEVSIGANTVTVGALIIATFRCNLQKNSNTTIRIRTGTSATGTINTERVSNVVRSHNYDNDMIAECTVMWWSTEEIMTSAWYAHTTVQHSSTYNHVYLKSMVVIGF